MMEQAHRLSELRKRGIEWDLNDWKWDGDLFIATPSNSQGQQFIPLVPVPGNSSNTSSSCSDDVDDGTGRRDLERKRRVFVVDQDSLEEAAPLTLKLGVPHRERDHWETSTAKKTKLPSSSSTRAICQVEDCEADLTKAKDYHRRHKVCELHSKATKALVANVMQRFCQQCSRFHALQEFDEGKRSCRRRLAGHNKRRRKTQPETAVQGNSIDDQTNSVLLMSLLRVLSNMHGNDRANQTTDQDLVAQLLKSLANPSGLHSGKGLSGLLHESQKLLNGGMANGNGHSEKMSAYLSNDQQNTPRVIDQHVQLPDSEIPRKGLYPANSRGSEIQAVSLEEPKSLFPIKDSPPAYSETTEGRMKLNNFDLNDAYVDSDDGMEDLERSPVNENFATGSVDFPSWARQDSHQSSPPQTSGNSDSASAQSPSSSSGEAQSRTDRIVFKLFGKEPNDFPIMLRGQILDWLAHSPTEIESYIRPGCIILTIYLRLAESSWEELCSDLSSRLTRLFDISDETFWRMGWVYVRVQNQIAIVHNGEVVLDTSLSLKDNNCCRILSVMPIAVSMDEQVQFKVRGFNLSQSTTSLLCSLEGKYLDQEVSQESEVGDCLEDDDETEHANLSCIIPKATGRGFIEVEDHGLSSSFFPFIVAEKDVCSEIRTLENVLELKKTDEEAYEINKTLDSWCQAMDFINEMGWLLHRSHLKSRLADLDPNTVIFSFRRFKWLMDFSMDHDWCAVVKKLLDILFAGTVGLGEHSSLKVALSEMGILHRAVRRNSRPMVEFLLRYAPLNVSEEFISSNDGGQVRFLFRPDAQGPAGLTPLHVAAGRDGSEDILDALTDDPGKNGVDAWKNARDSTGATPEDYARLRGHYAYIHIVQRKIYRSSTSGHVVVDIPGEQSVAPRQDGALSFEVGRSASLALNQSCKLCDQKKMSVYYGSRSRASLVYRPAMLSMVGIAAVCVCVALLFKSMPNVVCLFQPFRWEMLNYGSS